MVPQWFRIGILTLLALVLLGVVVAELATRDYETQPLALALVGAIGASIGGGRKRGGKGK